MGGEWGARVTGATRATTGATSGSHGRSARPPAFTSKIKSRRSRGNNYLDLTNTKKVHNPKILPSEEPSSSCIETEEAHDHININIDSISKDLDDVSSDSSSEDDLEL